MKQYSYVLLVKVLSSLFCIVFITLGFYSFLYDASMPVHVRLIGLGCGLMSILGLFVFWRAKILVTNEKFQYCCDFILFKTNQEITWSNVKCISTDYFFVPQFCIFKLLGKTKAGNNKIDFPIRSFPPELLKEVFSNIPRTTKLDLYPWLRKDLIKKGVNLDRFLD